MDASILSGALNEITQWGSKLLMFGALWWSWVRIRDRHDKERQAAATWKVGVERDLGQVRRDMEREVMDLREELQRHEASDNRIFDVLARLEAGQNTTNERLAKIETEISHLQRE